MTGDSDRSARIGLVGLGVMGAEIALRLRERGFEVIAWNLEPERYEIVRGAGVAWAESPREVWAGAGVALLCVLGDDAVQSVCFGADGFAAAGRGATLLIDLSTTSPAATRAAATRLAQTSGAAWVDAPMSGGPQAARQGALTLMIGGEAAACAAAAPVLDAIAANVTRMGALGAGQVTKILNQAIVGVNYVLMAELLALAEAANVDPKMIPACLQGGMADSTILQRIFPQMSARDFDPPRGYARQLSKDLTSVVAFVDALDLTLPVVTEAVRRYRLFAEDGDGRVDSAAVARLYERGGPTSR